MKRKIIYLVLIVLFCISWFIVIFQLLKQNSQKNGFIRVFVPRNISVKHKIKLGSSSFYFANNSNDYLILKDNLRPWLLFTLDSSMEKLKANTINLSNQFNWDSSYFRIVAQPPHTYLHASGSDDFIVLSVDTKKSRYFNIKSQHFDQFCPFSYNSIFVRAIRSSAGKKQREIVKLNINKDVALSKQILPRQVDGYFCTDGWMRFDRFRSRLYYMYYYRGEFLVLDTNLSVIIKGKTIDTISKANFKLKTILTKFKDGTILRNTTQDGIPKMVNECYATDANYIYILSGLKADNELSSTFEKNATIDMYNLKNGKYEQSFYVPKYKGLKLRQFEVFENGFYGLFGDYLVSF